MADPSFDVVSKIDRQEADNALNQAAKELSQRFDFRGTNASIAWAGELEGWLTAQPKWHLVADPVTAAEWENEPPILD